MNFLALTTTDVDWSFIWMVTILGFCLVLVLLFIFVYIMKGLGWIMRDRSQDAPKAPVQEAKPAKQPTASEADMAAVAMALSLYYGVHDIETPKLTLKGHTTAWNDKIFGMNNI